MAVIAPAYLARPDQTDFIGVSRIQWTPLTQTTSDTGTPVTLPNGADRSIQVSGTFGAGGTVIVEGMLEEAGVYATLHDPFGNALSITAAGVYAIAEATVYIRPRVSAGDGTTALKVTLMTKGMPR